MSRRFLTSLVLFLLLASCGSEHRTGRVIVLGLDGMDPHTIDLLMSEGKMPNFAKLRQDGAYSPLTSAQPLLSPVIWTTIATGRTPEEHGIGHFTAINPSTGEQLPVTSDMRKVKSVWEILSETGRSVAVVGWWATWPATSINGSIVSDHMAYHFLFEEGIEGGNPEGRTYPEGLAAEIEPLMTRPLDLMVKDLAPYVDVTQEDLDMPFEFTDATHHFRWALATLESYERIGLHLWTEKKPDILMVYIEGTDSTSHLFGHLFRAKGLVGELADQQKKYGRAVEQMYLRADELVGKYMDAMDDETTLIVVSDHGFELGVLQDDPSKTRDMRRVSERFHRLRGILYMYGRAVKKNVRVNGPSILDVTPTILALEGVPPATDMPGRVLMDGVELAEPVRVASYESSRRTPVAPGEEKAEVNREIMEKLRSLGYVGGAESPTGDRNIAALHFESGRYEEAAEIYSRLISENPDDGSLQASLAGVLGAMGRYDEALPHLDKAIELQPLNVEAYHNRAVIKERKGERQNAIEDYRRAVRYNPQYGPSRTALARLGENPDVNAPRTDAERGAFAMAQQASDLARRGDYDGARALLDQAIATAPHYVLLYQYESNVAYLAGDKAGAIVALEKALEIEPDNALFAQNLRKLREE